MVFCPNSGLRHLPAEYRSVLDGFYSENVAKRRHVKQESGGVFLTSDQFISGESATAHRYGDGMLNLSSGTGEDDDKCFFISYSEKYVPQKTDYRITAKYAARSSMWYGKTT
jgi:hypothetical protein